MLIASNAIVDAIVQKGYQIIIGFFLRIDAIIYNLVSGFYNIFLFLTKLNLFNYDDYSNIVKRIYIVLGVIMLFVLTYSLLRAVINPDEFAKGENSFPNIIKNVIVSLVIITLLPTIFDVVFRVQTVILNSDVIGKLILSDRFTTGVIASGGRTMTTNVFRAFIRLDESAWTSPDYASMAPGIENALNEAFLAVEQGQSFMIFTNEFVDSYGTAYYFPALAADNAIDYTFIVSTAAGVFLLWTVVLFCFDLGIRAIKLIYYQLIAPIAVVCRVMPGKKMKSVFDNWLKYTISTFFEVFIRIFVMYLGVYLITLVYNRMGSIFTAASNSNLNVAQRYLVVAFLIMGIVAFIRQAPKLIQDVFGFESGTLNLGFRKAMAERLGAGGALAAAGFVGGTAGGFGQRLRDARAAGRHGWRAAASAFAGGIGGGRRAFMKNLGSKSMEDLKKNTTEGINAALEKGRRNDMYRAVYGSVFGGRLNTAMEFFGAVSPIDAYQRELDAISSVRSRGIDGPEGLAREIMDRAEVANSDSIWQYVGNAGDPVRGITMSRSAMRQHLQSLERRNIREELANGPITVQDFYGNAYRQGQPITTQEEYDEYVAYMHRQFDDAERALQHHIQGVMHARNGVQFGQQLTQFEAQVGEQLGGGTRTRFNTGFTYTQDAANIVGENRQIFERMLAAINQQRAQGGLAPIRRVEDLFSTFDLADGLGNQMRNRENEIFVERERLQRRRGNSGGNNGGGH